MATDDNHRLIVIAGPSGVGKTPLWHALQCRHPELVADITPVVLYNDRAPRPNEKAGEDYRFRDRVTIERMRERPDHLVCEVRGDLQAVDLGELRGTLQESDLLFEGNPIVGLRLLEHRALRTTPRLSVFVSPLSSAALLELSRFDAERPRAAVTRLVQHKLLRRAQGQHAQIELAQLESIVRRARSAYDELRMAAAFDHVLVNGDGEDSDHWDVEGTVVGSARRAVDALAALLRNEPPGPAVEHWSDATVPESPPMDEPALRPALER